MILTLTPENWRRASKELAARDKVMSRFIESFHGELLRSRGNSFETLLRSIVGQQISVKAADSVWKKLCSLTQDLKPETLLNEKTTTLRKAGLSSQKITYIKDLSEHFLSGKLNAHEWTHLEDEEIIKRLIAVRGIGTWTAEMFLIFHLLRPNVFPVKDIGLQKALALSYSHRHPMSEKLLNRYRKKFEPWCSVATWYLWRSLDPIPVEY